MIGLLLPAAIISTISLEGDVTEDGEDYVSVPFEVPEGTVEIRFAHTDNSDQVIIDFGLEDPDGFRGWGGRMSEDTLVGVNESTRCYLTGPIAAGTWHVDIGKAFLDGQTVHWNVTLEFHDAPTAEPRPRAAYEPRVLERGARWYRGDFHVHSTESGDANASFDEIRDLARARGLDYVNLSDHNTVSQQALMSAYQADVDDLLFLRGSEVTTYGGHGTSVGNDRYIEHHIGRDGVTIQTLLDQVEDAGAIFIINHPKLDLGDGDACIGCPWTYDDADLAKVAGIELQTGNYDFIPIFGRMVIEMWDGMLDRGYHITGTGGSDDHDAPMIPDEDDSQVGTPCTLVYADELSEAAIIEGIRRGRVVVQMRGPDDPMVELTATTDAGEAGMIGDTLTGGRVELTAHVTGGAGMTLALWRNGAVDESVQVEGDDFEHTFTRDTREEGDRFRVHLSEAFDVVITNHIWVTFAPIEDDGGGGGCGCRAGDGGGGGAAGFALLAAAALWLGRATRGRRTRPR